MLQGSVHMGMLQGGRAARGVGTVGRGGCHGDARGPGTIRIKNEVKPAIGAMIQPDLGWAIHPAQEWLAKFGIQHIRGCPYQASHIHRRLVKG